LANDLTLATETGPCLLPRLTDHELEMLCKHYSKQYGNCSFKQIQHAHDIIHRARSSYRRSSIIDKLKSAGKLN
jgi:hypothetical protein